MLRHPAIAGPVDAASLAVFRIAFGLLMLVESLVYLKNGWVRATSGAEWISMVRRSWVSSM
jgi:hypothetical protein